MPTDCDVKQKSEPIWVLLTQSAWGPEKSPKIAEGRFRYLLWNDNFNLEQGNLTIRVASLIPCKNPALSFHRPLAVDEERENRARVRMSQSRSGGIQTLIIWY